VPTDVPDFKREVFYKTSRSGGSGGQHVNKVETAAEAWWHVRDSVHFTQQEQEMISAKLASRINKDGYLVVRSTDTRSQLENKGLALSRLEALVAQSLVVQRPRKATRPSRGAVERRLESKRRDSARKADRRKNW
jgi:ribosome-associated protein